MHKVAFAPIIDNNSRILLLGTMPGEESIRKQEYYAHKSNSFWKILFAIYNKPLASDYKERVALLIENRIALWDVLASCQGKGSADSNIINEVPNDFGALFDKYPHIHTILFASRKAESFYKKHIGFDSSMRYLVLPSPSPAYASMSFEAKLAQWNLLLPQALSDASQNLRHDNL